eukprot:g3708.t1
MRSRRGETESSMTKILEGLLKELKDDGVLMSDVKEGAEWVKEWLETLDLVKYFKLLVEIGEYDTKEKILKLTKEQLSDLNEDARDENMKPIRTASRHTLLDAIKEERERDTIRRHDCVHACIKLSVNELSKDEKEMFLRMAVFPEDAIIPKKCLEELWSEETSQKVRADSCIHRLVRANLVERTGRKGWYRLHDLCRDYVRSTVGRKIGDMQMEYVRRFSEDSEKSLKASSFRKCLFGSGDDQDAREFVRDNLMWHLKDSGTYKCDEAVELLVTLSFSIEWMEMRLGTVGNVVAVLNDLRTAREAWREWENMKGNGSKNLSRHMCKWLRHVEQVLDMSKTDIRRNPNLLAEHIWQRMHCLIEDEDVSSQTMGRTVAPWRVMVCKDAQRLRRRVGRMWSEVPWMKSVGGALLSVFKGHTSWVYSVAILNDPSHQLCKSGLCIVSGSKDKTVRIWDATGREGEDGCLRVFKRHSDGVTSVAILNDPSHQLCKSGLCIVSGSDDETVRIWDATGREGEDGCLRVFKGHSNWVKSVAILNDPSHRLCKSGLCIVSGSWDKTIRIWDATGTEGEDGCLRVFKGHSNRVNSVAILIDH